MCFSAGASFGAAAVLGTAGVAIMSKTKQPSQLPFAAMPFLFGLQQLCEGFEWLSFNDQGYEFLRIPMMYAFLTFAQVLWPGWVPVSIWLMEPDKQRKSRIGILSVIGLASSALLLYRLIFFKITSDIEGHHIHYDISSPEWMIYLSSVAYFISTLIAPLVSSLRYMKTLGLIMFAALIITVIFYEHYLISVWCFFAALLSVNIFFVLQGVSVSNSGFQSLFHKRIGPYNI